MAVGGKYKTLISNTAILGLGTFGSQLLVYFLMPLYTACLSSDQFDRADLIAQTANLLIPILSISICDAVFRFTLERAENRSAVLTTGLFVIGAGAVVGIPIAALLGATLPLTGYWLWIRRLYLKKKKN